MVYVKHVHQLRRRNSTRFAQRAGHQTDDLGMVPGRLDVAVGNRHEHRSVGRDALALLVTLDALGREDDIDDQRFGRDEEIHVDMTEQLIVRQLHQRPMAGPDQALRLERR